MVSRADPNEVSLVGENPILVLRREGEDENSTQASFWRLYLTPAGAGHVLFIRSDLTNNEPRVYSDNIALARWMQREIVVRQPLFADESLPIIESVSESSGDPRTHWTEKILASNEEIILSWYDLQEPFVVHSPPGDGGRLHGIYFCNIPANSAQATLNGQVATGKTFDQERFGVSFSSAFLAFGEKWVKPRQ